MCQTRTRGIPTTIETCSCNLKWATSNKYLQDAEVSMSEKAWIKESELTSSRSKAKQNLSFLSIHNLYVFLEGIHMIFFHQFLFQPCFISSFASHTIIMAELLPISEMNTLFLVFTPFTNYKPNKTENSVSPLFFCFFWEKIFSKMFVNKVQIRTSKIAKCLYFMLYIRFFGIGTS